VLTSPIQDENGPATIAKLVCATINICTEIGNGRRTTGKIIVLMSLAVNKYRTVGQSVLQDTTFHCVDGAHIWEASMRWREKIDMAELRVERRGKGTG
jgi:hypothetical protein